MSVFVEAAAVKPPLVIARHRHLKWSALDPLEFVLMLLCGVAIDANVKAEVRKAEEQARSDTRSPQG